MDVLAQPELIAILLTVRILLPRVTAIVTLALVLHGSDPAERPALLDAAAGALGRLHRTPQKPFLRTNRPTRR